MLEKIKQAPLWRQQWVQFIVFVFRRFETDRCRDMASSLTYTTLFAVVPMLTVFLVIISSISALEPARQQLQTWIYSNFLPKSSIAFDKALDAFTQKSSNLTVIGVLFLFFTTVMMLSSIEQSFNRIWRVRKSRSGIMGFMRYWTIISLGPILLGTAFALSSAVTSMNFLNNTIVGYELNFTFLLSFSSYALTCLGISLLYWTIPNRTVPLRSAFIAGIFSGSVFILLKQLFGFVITNFTSYQLIYGAFAAVPIFLLWIFASWNIILLGVEISYSLTAFHSKSTITRHPMIMMLDILQLFYQKQKVGKTVSDKEALDILGRGEIGRWAYYVELLEKQKIIAETDSNEYVLIRNLSHVNLWDFMTEMPFALPHRKDLGNVHPDDTWMQVLGPRLADADDYLAAKLSIPLAKIFESP